MRKTYFRRSIIGVALGTLFFASVAIADIIVGQSNTSLSNDVAYTVVTLNKPAGAVSGDLLVASVAVNGGSPASITPPDGWSLIKRTDNDTNVSIATYSKAAGGSEPSNYTWTISPQTRATGGITRYSGVAISNPIDTVADASGRGTTASAPSIVTTRNNERLLAVFADNVGTNNSPLFSTTSGMSKLYDVKNAPFGPTAAAEDALQAVAGSVGPFVSTISSGAPREWVAQTIAIKTLSLLENGIVGYWKFDETSGNASDSVGGNTLTNHNSATYVTGKINNAGLLAAASSQYFSHSYNSTLNLANSSFTHSVWVKLTSCPPAGNGFGLDGMYEGAGSVKAYLFYAECGQLRLAVENSSPTDVGVPYTLSTGTYYLLTVTYNADTGATKFYVNGAQVGSTQTSTTGGSHTSSGTPDFTVGAFSNPVAAFIDSQVDELGIWNRELTSAEVAQLYNNGSGLQYPF